MKIDRRGLLLAGLLAPAAAFAEQFAGKYQPQAQPIGEGIWMVRGADEAIGFANGGAIANSAIIATDAGAVLFDPGVSREHGLALGALAQRLTGKPVGRVYISHLHPDHAMGAAAFDPAIIHALPATRAELERDGEGFSDAMYRLLADWMKGTAVVLPQGDLAGGSTQFGGRPFRLLALKGHSGGDLAMIDERTATLVTGDLVFHDRAPSTPHASLPDWRASLGVLAGLPHKVLVPGHGPLDRDGSAIAQTRDWLDWVEQSLHKAVVDGLDMSEAGDLPIPARFAALKAARYELQRSVSHFYPRLEAELLPKL
ncbi:quinoprotein relay system zinc metallohydrolase 1 [Novosphingobium sp. B1]|uniref:quinoprotein relay system zinc metallohydrolase 1 n=1 Tax=Novosphingobium sp. B1 TaxID=1938756 RepID=UPI0009D7D24E|nr:quinoprotein relay system zinc metallohydrolase 1 [Novosphingobium sp. B1]SMC39220.1 quinoprotein relay system zinc metallohydrolase 1 [Novosphingobium sp. B1]